MRVTKLISHTFSGQREPKDNGVAAVVKRLHAMYIVDVEQRMKDVYSDGKMNLDDKREDETW